MNCSEAQSYFKTFIDGDMKEDLIEEFIEHVESCSDCYDELEVYFIVHSGLKQLDDDEEDISDFKAAFKELLNSEKAIIQKKKRAQLRKRSVLLSILSVFAVAAACVILIYIFDRDRLQTENLTRYRNYLTSEYDADIIVKRVEYTLEYSKFDQSPYKQLLHNKEVKHESESESESERPEETDSKGGK